MIDSLLHVHESFNTVVHLPLCGTIVLQRAPCMSLVLKAECCYSRKLLYISAILTCCIKEIIVQNHAHTTDDSEIK